MNSIVTSPILNDLFHMTKSHVILIDLWYDAEIL